MAQSHASVLQLRDSRSSLGQTLPPKAEPLLTVRERMETPPPHVLEHGAQSDQSEAEQSTGQLCALQTRTSASVGQLLPPCSDATRTDRLLCLVPPPHTAGTVLLAKPAQIAESTPHVVGSYGLGHASPPR